MKRNEYEEQAEQFLAEHGLVIRTAFKGDKCPAWEEGNLHIHGDRYRVTIKRITSGPSISFDFWNSQRDKEEDAGLTGYSVLAAINSDAYSPTDPDEVAAEYGDMKPSQAIAIARFAKRLQTFFTEDELEALAEIQ